MPDNVVGGGNGLVPESEWRGSFPDVATSLLDSLRHGLEARVPELGEKVNLAQHYFGYSAEGGSDAAYIHVQRGNLVPEPHATRAP